MKWLNSLTESRKKIQELEDSNKALTAERDTAAGALTAEKEANASALKALKDEVATLTDANAKLSKESETAITEATKAKAAVVDFDAKVKAAADLKASEIMASFGVKPVALPADSASTKGANTKTRSDFFAMTPAAQMAFVKSGGKIAD